MSSKQAGASFERGSRSRVGKDHRDSTFGRIRFLLEVSEAQPITRQEAESKEVRWFASAEIETRFEEESILRMARKAATWRSRLPVGPS